MLHAPPARRRAVRATRAASTRCATRCARRARSRPTCRSSSAAPGRRRRSGRSRDAGRRLEHLGHGRRGPGAARRSSTSTARRSAGTAPTIELTVSFPITIRDTVEAAERGRAERFWPRTASRTSGAEPAPRSARRRWSPRRSRPTATSGSGPSSPACRRRSIARRSSGSARSPRCSMPEAGAPRVVALAGRRRRREARPRACRPSSATG